MNSPYTKPFVRSFSESTFRMGNMTPRETQKI